ncbi:MAG: D-alanyl-D-alanine carboxypeptidase family protein [Streptosporangiaceae bacterium]
MRRHLPARARAGRPAAVRARAVRAWLVPMLLVPVLLAPLLLAGAAPAAAAPVASAAVRPAGPGPVVARSGELASAVTGRRLWGRRLTAAYPIGSITKVMTALVVIRAGDLERPIRITRAEPAYVRRYGASTAGLVPGDVLTARQLLEALLLPSGCDAAYALATAYGPGRKEFVARMNATARQLGMTGTHFANFDGLPWPARSADRSTPRDLMILGRAAMRLATFRRIVRQRAHAIAADRRHHGYYWRTTNLLLGSYPGAVGIKTGWTPAAGYCLLFEARRGATTLIGVVLHSTDSQPDARFAAAAQLLNWGFAATAGRHR